MKLPFSRRSTLSPYSHSLKLSQLLLMSLKNLAFKKLRTFLTIAGVVIGIAAITFLASLGLGLQRTVTQEVVDSSSIRTVDITSPKSQVIRLDKDNTDRINRLAYVAELGRNFTFAGNLTFKDSTAATVVYGMDKTYMELSTLKLVEGKPVTDFDSTQAVVNTSLLRIMGINNPKEALNLRMNVTAIRPPKNSNDKIETPIEIEIMVVGVAESGSSPEIFMGNKVFEKEGTSVYTQLKVVVDDNKNVEAFRNQVQSFGFETKSTIDTLEQVNQIFRFFTFILVGFGTTGMLIAILGMLNTLTVALLERTREIALMVTLGARARDIRRLFIIEALILAVGGGMAGIFVAWLTGKAVDLTLTAVAHSRGIDDSISLFIIPWWLALAVVSFAAIVGMAVVYFPARRAERISPVDALRNE